MDDLGFCSHMIPMQLDAMIDAYRNVVPLDGYPTLDEIERQPELPGLRHNEVWAAIKMARAASLRKIPLVDCKGRPFQLGFPSGLSEVFNKIDRWGADGPGAARDTSRALATSLREESAASAILAGAGMSQSGAEEMLRCGRQPEDRDERMVFNMYRALESVQELGASVLSPTLVLELHRAITEGTLDPADASGRLRRDGETAGLQGLEAGEYAPPDARELEGRLESMCAFANGEGPGFFVHPVARAILLHFRLAYERPFVDGNGRTARVLFRWAMLRQGYPLFAFVALSPVLAAEPARYGRAFRQTETDDNDLTYFVLHQAGAIGVSMNALADRAARDARELSSMEARLPGFAALNRRQQALIAHALRHSGARYVIAGHQRSHGVTHQTARDDLFDLERRELLIVGKEGRTYFFQAAADLRRTLQSAVGRRRAARAIQSDELPTNLL